MGDGAMSNVLYMFDFLLFWLCLSVICTGFLYMFREAFLLFIYVCKHFGWSHLYNFLLASLPYKYKRKYLHIYEEIILPWEEN